MKSSDSLWCPNLTVPLETPMHQLDLWLSQAQQGEGVWILGEVSREGGPLQVGFFAESGGSPQLLTSEALQQGAPDVLTQSRLAGPCARQQCAYFADDRCEMAHSLEDFVPATRCLEALPVCGVRAHCLWWHQQGIQACARCDAISNQHDDCEEVRLLVQEAMRAAKWRRFQHKTHKEGQ